MESASKHYSLSEALNAWTGPCSAPQDFSFKDGYVEVKALLEKAGEVKIASLDQLDPIGDLYLVLVGIKQNDGGLSLKEKVAELREIFSDPQYELLFNENLLMYGYSEEMGKIGSDKRYSANIVSWYRASAPDFPSLRRTAVDPAISRANYVLTVSAIESFKTEGLF